MFTTYLTESQIDNDSSPHTPCADLWPTSESSRVPVTQRCPHTECADYYRSA